jgi:DNA-directed RNA polymerase I, II, and III subunit RPABC2
MIEDFNDIMITYDASKNVTRNILSKYEKVKILGLRAEQLQRGAQPYIDVIQPFNPLEVAKQELYERKIPFMVCRKLSNGVKEYWRLDDLIII